MNSDRLDAVGDGAKLARFGREEINTRVRRLQSLMEASELDAVLVCSKPNVTYLSGLVTESFASTARPMFVIVPRDGEPGLVCSASQAPNARAASQFQNILTFTGFEPEAVDVVVRYLAETGLSKSRVGMEFGREMRIGLTVGGLEEFRTSLPGVELVDVASLIWQLRMVKSDAEIALLERAGQCNAAALDAVLDAIAPGISERRLRAIWASVLANAGADLPGYFVIHSGPGSYNRVNSSASHRELQVGDLVWIDAGAVWDGYWSDITRLASVGEPSEDRMSDYEFSYGLVGELVELAVPGAEVSRLAERAREGFEAAGLPMNAISRVGHGIGLELTEPPSLGIDEETALRPGMTIAIEAGVSHANGYFVVEENVVITETGNRLLAPSAQPTLFVGG